MKQKWLTVVAVASAQFIGVEASHSQTFSTKPAVTSGDYSGFEDTGVTQKKIGDLRHPHFIIPGVPEPSSVWVFAGYSVASIGAAAWLRRKK